jgi:hypothetical protein
MLDNHKVFFFAELNREQVNPLLAEGSPCPDREWANLLWLRSTERPADCGSPDLEAPILMKN